MKRAFPFLAVIPFTVLVACVAACKPPAHRETVVDVADSIHQSLRTGESGTAGYPRAELDHQTRVLCNSGAQPQGLTGVQLSATLDLPAGARIELGYGVDAAASFSMPIDLAVSLSAGTASRQAFTTTLDGTAGDFGRWHDAVIDAGDWSGKVRLEITSASQLSGLDLVEGRAAATMHVGCPIVTSMAEGAPPPGVVLVSLDTLRADRLGVYGYDRPTTPNIDRYFGKDGVVVDRVLSPASNTLRAHAAMLSGIDPAICVDDWSDPVLARMGAFPTLADELRARGFRTAAFTEDGYVSHRYFGLGAGFEIFDERTGSPGNVHIAGTIRETFDKGLAWLQRQGEQPFFLFLHSYQVHAPYRPSRAFRERFPSPAGAPPARSDSDLYDGEVAETDAAVGALMARLGSMGLLERTLVVVTSDHGEEFAEHGGRYHGAHLTQEILHVPLLLHGAMLPKGVRRAGPMSLTDLAPTILGLIGISRPDVMTGRCLADHLRGGTPVAYEPIVSIGVASSSQTYGPDDSDWRSPTLAVTRWPHRFVRTRSAIGTRDSLYDLEADPRERDDLLSAAGALPAGLDDLRRRLDSFDADSASASSDLRKKLRVTSVAPRPAGATDPTRAERLRALGYAQ